MNRQPISNEQLQKIAPSVFATNAASNTSDIYTFLPTSHIVDLLKKEGWAPVWANEQRVRDVSREGFQKHMLRFQFQGENKLMNVGDSVIELVLINGHDGTVAYQLHAGIFRLVCSNGMVVADSTFNKIAVRHVGFDPNEVIEASYEVIREVPTISKSVEELQSIELTGNEQLAYATAALDIKFKEGEHKSLEPKQLLTVRRWDEKDKKDLWTTHNIVQENILKGGLRGRSKDNKIRRTRQVKSINEDLRLNKGLWTLSEEMKKLKVA